MPLFLFLKIFNLMTHVVNTHVRQLIENKNHFQSNHFNIHINIYNKKKLAIFIHFKLFKLYQITLYTD